MDIVILSHLQRGPVHGYELKRNVSATTSYSLHNNTLYPALRRFEEAGAVTKTAEAQEGRPPRHVYALTDLGREMLHDLLADLPAELATDEPEFLTRLGQFEHLTPAERHGVLDARAAALRKQGAHLRALGEKTARSPRDHRWGELVVAELGERIERELAWIARLAERADEPGGPAHEQVDEQVDGP
ncbi:PadR family transcriptional regulator [Dactylosporangium vinaceum]|uniref:PadR family transcriptional regulator n=1 Tax=Dactylosporangium vinaceum TaxID=53362 RepID=A0ABV5MBZ4_9ACTN|nr:PadR family transcriptional regulator [Dactylosporangium vinaceum]